MGAKRDDSFLLLRQVSDALSAANTVPSVAIALRPALQSLGAAAIPLLIRHLVGAEGTSPTLASTLIFELPNSAHSKLIAELKAATRGVYSDAGKLAALRLLTELGVGSAPSVQLAHPMAEQRLAAAQFAGQLGTDADVAAAAALMIEQLDPDDLVAVLLVMVDEAPDGAARLLGELTERLDLPAELRTTLRRASVELPLPPSRTLLPRAATRRFFLRHADGSSVLARLSRVPGCRQQRGFALLINSRGQLVDCWYDDAATIARLRRHVLTALLRNGYVQTASDHDDATVDQRDRERASAAVIAAVRAGQKLPTSYYLGRDLLALGDAHMLPRGVPQLPAMLHDRAVTLMSQGQPAAAHPILERAAALAPHDSEIAANLGLCLLTLGDVADARRWLERARAMEPSWPLHHWNVAAAAHRAGATEACQVALRQYLLSSSGILVDVDPRQQERRTKARQILGDVGRLAETKGQAGRTIRRPARRPGPSNLPVQPDSDGAT